jgi:hypothetical protein
METLTSNFEHLIIVHGKGGGEDIAKIMLVIKGK